MEYPKVMENHRFLKCHSRQTLLPHIHTADASESIAQHRGLLFIWQLSVKKKITTVLMSGFHVCLRWGDAIMERDSTELNCLREFTRYPHHSKSADINRVR